MSDLTRQDERILRSAQRAGLRMSRNEGHAPSREALLNLRVQVAPPWARIVSGFSGLGAALGSWNAFAQGMVGWGIGGAFLAVLLLYFALFGIRRTLRGILDGLDATHSAELFSAIVEGVFSAVGSLID